MGDREGGERVKGHSFLIENILNRDDRTVSTDQDMQSDHTHNLQRTNQDPQSDRTHNHRSTTENQGSCSCSDSGDSPDLNFKLRHKKKTRTVFSRHQIFYLESAFEMKRYLSSTDRSEMARTLKLTETQVKVWFQNRRNKWKSQMNGQESYSPDPPLYPHYNPLSAADPRLQPRFSMFHQVSPFYY